MVTRTPKLPSNPAIDKLVAALPDGDYAAPAKPLTPSDWSVLYKVADTFAAPYEGFILDPVAAVAALREAKVRNDELQHLFVPDTAAWHHCETVDDRLTDAMAALGQ